MKIIRSGEWIRKPSYKSHLTGKIFGNLAESVRQQLSMKKFRKVKSLVRPSGYSKKVAEKFSSKQLSEAIEILEKSYRSEDPHSYADEDFSFGPALGAAAHAGREFNNRLRILIAILRKELHRMEFKNKRNAKTGMIEDSFLDGDD